MRRNTRYAISISVSVALLVVLALSFILHDAGAVSDMQFLTTSLVSLALFLFMFIATVLL